MPTAKKKVDITAILERIAKVEEDIQALARLRQVEYKESLATEDPERVARELSKEYRHLTIWVTYADGDSSRVFVAPTLPSWLGQRVGPGDSADYCLRQAEEFLKHAPARWPLFPTLSAFARGVTRTKAQDDKIKALEKKVEELQTERTEHRRIQYLPPFPPSFYTRG